MSTSIVRPVTFNLSFDLNLRSVPSGHFFWLIKYLQYFKFFRFWKHALVIAKCRTQNANYFSGY